MTPSSRSFVEVGRINRGALGFTLIELLAVMAVVGILFAILLSATRGVMDRAKSIQNTSNLRSLHQGLMLVVNEGPPGAGKGPGFFPSYAGFDGNNRRYTWIHLVAATLGYARIVDNEYVFDATFANSPFQNPFREDVNIPTDDANNWNGQTTTSHYGYNSNLGGWSTSKAYLDPRKNLMMVANPSRTILLGESNGDGVNELWCTSWAPPGRNEDPDKAAVVFVDGHAEILPREKILSNQQRYFNPSL